MEEQITLEDIVSLCKRRGFVYPSSDIYGGFAGVYDYGHYGILLKNNIQAAWWRHMVQLRDDVYGLDSAIFMHPTTWVASGHVGGSMIPRWTAGNARIACARITSLKRLASTPTRRRLNTSMPSSTD